MPASLAQGRYGYGLMGGTFDPIHYGHLVTAEEARVEFGLKKVVFIPSGRPPHKEERPITPAQHRYIMTSLAVATNPFFEVSRVEVDRPGYSYTYETVKHFRELIGAEAEIFFITGADALLEILTWRNIDDLMSSCQFIGATRPGYGIQELNGFQAGLKPEYRSRIHLLEVPALAISSTDIRRRVKSGRSIKYLVPEAVERYIISNRLYV
ncbi:MAG: nicotinate-nucleotide adenylyltransferase [Clostridia bacterium]|nr:nicotinate-nucleotide adenylyltransferase [Clostridia bacterium]